jgi:gamma-glutamyltranspeptidase/glutathione hydrolase
MDVAPDTVLVEKGTWMEALGPDLLKLGHARVQPFAQLLRTTGALHTPSGWVAAFDPRLDPLVAIPATPQESPSAGGGSSEGQ